MLSIHELRRYKLISKRLMMQVIDESYAKRVLSFVIRNREALVEWEPQRNSEYYTLENQLQSIRQEMQGMENGQSVRFWLTAAEEPDGELIGTVSLSNIVRGAFHSCHLGYRMDICHRNNGLMTEALSNVTAFAFDVMNLHRIEANIMPRNIPSLKVCERLGFQQEGIARDYLRINGKWEDHIHMVLLNPTWSEH